MVLRPIWILWGSKQDVTRGWIGGIPMYTCGRVEGQLRTECDKGLPSFQFSPPPQKKTPPRSFVPRIWDVKEKECYLVNYTCNLGHLCCRLTHRVLTQKSALHQRSQASQTYRNTCTVKIYITLYFVKKIWITPDAMPIWKKMSICFCYLYGGHDFWFAIFCKNVISGDKNELISYKSEIL